MKRIVASAMAVLVGVSAAAVVSANTTKASEPAMDVTKLSADTVYNYDLDQDGTDEALSFTLTKKGVYELSVNGEKTKVDLDEEYYNPELTIMDIDVNDGCLDLWADCYADSDDVCFSALYRYEDGALKCIWEPEACGTVISTDGSGTLTLCYDRMFPADLLIGNHWDEVSYTVNDDTVTPVDTDTYKIAATMSDDYTFEIGKIASLTCAADTTMSKEAGSDDTFTLAAGTKVTPEVIKTESEDNCYVEFTTEDGQTGWLYSGDFGWENLPFSDIVLCD